MKWLVETALRQRLLVVALAVVFLVFGLRAVRATPLDVFPEFAPPRVEIQTEAPGLSTEEVESLVTVPLEHALSGVSWLKTIRSKSVLGLSSVLLLFEEGTDLMRARQLVAERLAVEGSRLPAVARPPVMLPPLSSMSRAMKIGLWSKTLSQMELSALARWTVRPRLMAVPGVANVAIWGQRDKQYQVLVDADRLRAHGVTLDAVVRAAGDASVIAAGGFVDTPNQRIAVRHVAPEGDADQIARSVVAFRAGAPIRIGDVAEVVVGHPPPIGDAIINDVPGILLIVEKQPWGNTLDVSREVERALAALRPGLAGVEVDSTIFRPATFIERSLGNLTTSLLVAALLVAAVLGAFLADLRTAVISVVAIPLSLLAAALVLRLQGGTLNTMALAGMVIAVGEVVDDAIIDVENIERRLRLNRGLGSPRPDLLVVLEASLEVRSAVVYASLVVGLVFLPVFFLDGLAGAFFRPLALSYVLAILASLFVALTLTPALCLLLLPRAVARHHDAALVTALKGWYRRALPRFLAAPRRAAVALAAAFVLAAAAVPFLGEELLPSFRETDFLMHFVEKPGTSLEAMDRVTILASKELRAIPGVRNFGSHVGRAEVADEVVGPNFTELWISIDERADHDATVAKIQAAVDGYPGLQRDLLTYLKERIKEVLSGTSASIVVRVFGPDLAALRQQAGEVGKVMGAVAGVTDLKVEPQVLVPQIAVRLRPDAAARFGLTPGHVRRAVGTMVAGRKVGERYEEQKIFDVVVWGVPRARADLAALRALPVDAPSGAQVPLGDVADVEIVPAPNEIKREGTSRRIDVSCNVKGRDLGAVAREIEEKVRAMTWERGYHPEFLGEHAARVASQRQLLGLAGLSLLGILFLLYLDFRSLRLALLVFGSLPFALVGGVAGAVLGGGNLSLGSLIGFVTVLGIAGRNGIMLVSHYRHLEEQEGIPFGDELLRRGAEERLSPILMTALCAGLSLLPLVVRGDVPGQEIEHPMAWVILGGLVTSTAINLFFMPALYGRFGRVDRPAEG